MIYIRQIISGGQTGADIGGLRAARVLGLHTGGEAPRYYMNEQGRQPWLRDFDLIEGKSASYPSRTRVNVLQSDGTVIFTPLPMGRGSRLTFSLCVRFHKPHFVVSMYDLQASRTYEFLYWLKLRKIVILNVAGSRESSWPGMEKLVESYLVSALDVKSSDQ